MNATVRLHGGPFDGRSMVVAEPKMCIRVRPPEAKPDLGGRYVSDTGELEIDDEGFAGGDWYWIPVDVPA